MPIEYLFYALAEIYNTLQQMLKIMAAVGSFIVLTTAVSMFLQFRRNRG